MAVFTGAVLAVGAAIASTTVATVATAVVAVSAAVGVAGLAVTAVGLVTKNQDLLKVGKIMGYVGLAGGLAGGVIGGVGNLASGAGTFMEGAADAYAGASQFLKEGWDSGVGQLFAGGEKVAGAAPGVNANAPSTSIGSAPPTSGAPTGSGGPIGGPTDMSTAVNQPSADVLASQQAAMGPSPTVAPSVATPGTPYTIAPGTPDPFKVATPVVGGGGSPTSFLGNMPDWAKYSMMTTAGQGVSGLASGYFAGVSAEEALKQKQLENTQAQNQIQLLNKQGSYAPLISFRGPGLAQSGGR